MASLTGQVTLVAGATRGAGRGIARMLGEAGATVYCTGRSSRLQPNTSTHHYAKRPETIEETAELVTAAGGEGVAARVDHTVEREVEQLVKRIKKERGRLDVLVNVLTHAPVTAWQPFWKLSVADGKAQFDGWVWPHVWTVRHALPLMIAAKSGLVVEVIEQEGLGYHGQFWFDMYEAALKRLAYGVAEEGAPHGITALAITPGFMRTEAIKEQFGATDANWREVALSNPQAKGFGFIASETPCFVGRAIAALAADRERRRFSGGVYSSATLNRFYDFTDLDGTRPDMQAYLKQHHADLFRSNAAVQWVMAGRPEPRG